MITASIVTFNTDIECVTKLISCLVEVDRIFLIDNSPTNALCDLTNFSSKLIYIYNDANLGYGKAHNIGIKESIRLRAKYHIIVNPDIYVENGIIGQLAKFMDENDVIGLVMPKILYPNGDIQYLCKLLPTPFNLFGRRFIPFQKYVNKINQLYELRDIGYESIMEVPSLSGCFMFIRTEILMQVGGFDERYFMYLEDVDLCRKIGEISKTVFYPFVSVYHDYGRGSYQNLKLLKFHIRSAIKYFNKWGWFFDKKRRKVNKRILSQINSNGYNANSN